MSDGNNQGGHYVIRPLQLSRGTAAGMLGIYWLNGPSDRGQGVHVMTLEEDRLPLLAAAVATKLKADADVPGRAVPVQRLPEPTPTPGGDAA